jgi:hypothetical protein
MVMAPAGKRAVPASQLTSYLTTNTFIVVLIVLFIIGSGVYFYNAYQTGLTKAKQEQLRAIEPNICPDYWEIVNVVKDNSGRINSIQCKNIKRIGKVALGPVEDTFTFDDDIFNNPNSKGYAKCQWAKQNNVAWTGYDSLC